MADIAMRYRVTCLTPTLVGDGHKLAPIDYMVWKDQINVLDQTRIFRLLSKGPRLENYLTQIRKAEKLEFASWGGFAQNYAGRRIPFEHSSNAAHWERARAESLFIPTFASGLRGPYLPGSALRGALRTGLVHARWSEPMLRDVAAKVQADRIPRRPADALEQAALGSSGQNRMRATAAADSDPIASATLKVYLLRVSTLVARGGKFELGWKTAPRGTVDGRRPDDSTPIFVEMASPGTAFEGDWEQRAFFAQPDILRALHWKDAPDFRRLCEAANGYAAQLLTLHRQYADAAGLTLLASAVESLQARLEQARTAGNAALVPLGWGTGLLGKSAVLDTKNEDYRKIMRQVPLYARAIESNMPFPKTRRVVFLGNQPATLPGWTLLEVQ
jgi:CRISPR-associated protein Csm5